MPSIADQKRDYRRGLVLGLTMAEIFVLVIFVLLLVLSALLARQARDAAELRERIAILEAADADPDKEVARLRELEQALETARPHGAPERPLPEVFRDLVLLRDAIADAGIAPEPEALRQKLAEAPDAQKKLVKEKARLAREVENLKSRMANLRRQAQSGGRGLDHPPCWPTREGKAEYTFDVALTSRGLIIRDRELPHRMAERAELPFAGIVFGEDLTPEQFLSMTAPLYLWSVNNRCRFVVRAFDATGPTEKTLYKRHLRALEKHFYKYEPPNERF